MPRKKLFPDLLSLRQTCEILKVHPNTLRIWDRKGILKAVRMGIRGDRKFRRDDVNNLIIKGGIK